MIESNVISCSVKIGPRDSRCRYWAKIIRAGVDLPPPSAVSGASDIPGAYLRNGEDELFAGDILIEGEANHHVKSRGWTYWVTVCGPDGSERMLTANKATMKAAGLPSQYLAGSGEVAACVRMAHAYRLGLV